MQSFTPWLNGISVYMFIGYLIILLATYLVCIIAYSYKLQQTIKRLSENNNGLANQHEIDLTDKKRLRQELGISQKIIELLINSIPSEKIPETIQRIDLIKGVYNIGTRNEDSKDN
mgnify:CR=1 FL=1